MDETNKVFHEALYLKMESFHTQFMDTALPLAEAKAKLREAMYIHGEFTPAEIQWYFSLYKPFPKWTPLTGWMILKEIINHPRKRMNRHLRFNVK